MHATPRQNIGSCGFQSHVQLFLPSASIAAFQVLELSRCSIADSDMAVLCKGLADARCRIRVLILSNNIDLRDQGATGGLRTPVRFCWMSTSVFDATCAQVYDTLYPISRTSSMLYPPVPVLFSPGCSELRILGMTCMVPHSVDLVLSATFSPFLCAQFSRCSLCHEVFLHAVVRESNLRQGVLEIESNGAV